MASVETQCPKEGEEVLGTDKLNYSARTAGGEGLQPGFPQQGRVDRIHQSERDLLVWVATVPSGTMGPRKISSKTNKEHPQILVMGN